LTLFERSGAGYIRFSCANSVDNIRDVIKRIAALLWD
jgi:aspartate/methionine/tyrosine aminotransferase